ncbi:hypothetical protein [Oceanobacillus chungangensis]|uniref:Uncharacterized protein n=1 Tax=Oceanobacillus chungangensis TaxID=1229152 RepID=A0A3D8PRV6_9BACI|nr:hypothetical protein [Oceanobacillus chungangensis]RDW17705.1 hypothetical protein CWR45_10215 [Oceanobacillus chungangensis]
MKKLTKILYFMVALFILAGCGSNTNEESTTDSSESSSVLESTEEGTTKEDDSTSTSELEGSDIDDANDISSEGSVNIDSDSASSENSDLNVGGKEDKEIPSQHSTEPDNTSTKNQSKPDNTSQSTDDSSTDSTVTSDNSGENDSYIKSGEEAVQYLKQKLPEGEDEDISFGVDETLRTDDNGSYYTIQLVDIPLRISGKTGNLGYYKVYQDGTYKVDDLNQ